MTGVAVSVAINLGPNLGHEKIAPKFWGHLTNGDKDGMIRELRNFGPVNPDRRKLEGDYLDGKYP